MKGKVLNLREGHTEHQLQKILGSTEFLVVYYDTEGEVRISTSSMELRDLNHLVRIANMYVEGEYHDKLGTGDE